MSQQRIILIGGPTASGKSALAMQIARERQGVIINADAMQIYKELPILTAQPSEADRQEIPHLLYEVIDPSEPSSAGIWLSQAREAIEKTLSEKRTPILVGGTGLYFEALRGGLADIPSIPEDVRHKVQDIYEQEGEEAFRKRLKLLDEPSAARIARNDRQRLMRAYEVASYTGKTLGEWQKTSTSTAIEGMADPEVHLLLPERDKLYEACDRRFLSMIESGALEEVKRLLARRLNPDLPAMKILGVRELIGYLRGETSLDEAVLKAQQMTRNYAKRQITWFRNRWKNYSSVLTN